MGSSKISFLNYRGSRINVKWFKVSDTRPDDYFQRVVNDKGTIEATDCVRAYFEEEDYTFDCSSTQEPLSFRYHGERYSQIRGSEITFRVLVSNDTEANLIRNLLNGGYYVNVLESGNVTWIGKVFPQFFTESYTGYPYTIEINASDQLGQLKDQQPIMVDFPEPYPTSRVSLMDLINKLLTDPLIKPAAELATAPDELRTAIIIYYANEGKFLEEIYIDPLVFMNDDNTYKSKYEILKTIFEPLHLSIIQWEGRWHIYSQDAMWDAGKYTFRNYSINYRGWEYKYGNTSNPGILDLYNNQDDPDLFSTRQVYNNAVMEYLPAWRGVTFEQDFQPNNVLLNNFANVSGDFFYGQDGVQLEFDAAASTLRHWTYNNGGIETIEYLRNAGYVRIPVVRRGQASLRNVSSSFNFGTIEYNGFELTHSSFSDFIESLEIGADLTVYLQFEIKLVVDGNTFYFWEDTNSNLTWSTDFHLLRTSVGDKTIRIPLPEDYETSGGTITLAIYFAECDGVALQNTARAYIKNLRFRGLHNKWDAYNFFSENIFTGINPLVAKDEQEVKLTWGISNPDLDNDHEIHISTPYWSDGTTREKFFKEGPNNDFKTPVEWLTLNYFDDNSTFTPQLKGTWRTYVITPFVLARDYEDRIYSFTNAERQVKGGFWNVTYTEFSAVTGVSGLDRKCDFSTFDFNADFCTLTDSIAVDFETRVEADSGTMEAVNCVSTVITNLE